VSTPTMYPLRSVKVGDITIAVQEYGQGEPLLVVNGTSQPLGFGAIRSIMAHLIIASAWAGSRS
jgi:hypothetical protein